MIDINKYKQVVSTRNWEKTEIGGPRHYYREGLVIKHLSENILTFVKSEKLKIIKAILISTIFFFLGLYLYKNWGKLPDYQWHFNYFTLSTSFILAIISYLLGALGYNLILRSLGENLNLFKGMKLWLYSLLGKYVPGTIWAVGGRIYLFGKEDISVSKTTVSVALESAIAIQSGILLFLLSIPLGEKLSDFPMAKAPILLIVVGVGMILLHPTVLNSLLNYILLKLRREQVTINLQYQRILKLMLFYLMHWIIYGFAFYLFVISIQELPFQRVPSVIGLHSLAYIIGFVSIFAPGGLGIREGVLVILLGYYMPLPVATIVALSSRIWITLAEISCIGLAFVAKFFFEDRIVLKSKVAKRVS